MSTFPHHPSQHAPHRRTTTARPTAHRRQVKPNCLPLSLFPSSSSSSTEAKMSDQRVSASMLGSSDTSSKEFTLTPYQKQALVAVIDIFIPCFRPDVLMTREISQSLIEKSLIGKLDPIFRQVTQSLSFSECAILSSAKQGFNPWGLHQFALSKNRDYQVEQGMANRYGIQVKYLEVAEFDLSFDKLKQKLEERIEPLARDQNCTFDVLKAFTGLTLTIQMDTEEDLASYLIHQTTSFCYACIKESDYSRPLLRAWFISEGAQHIETCIGMLDHAVTYLDVDAAFRMMAIIYCGFRIQDEMILEPYTIPGRRGDCRQPQKNRRAFFKCIDNLRQNERFSQDLGIYGSYADSC
ncbi:hypothetical protein VC83_03521 [Pseudogymnoascus destructans]|uniref:Uncharacterized protein n=2 Tax=Pseudogymnoascus destructans TaxID=655981 RepID=L8G698_PSED2|nr:uncharacterized protein VC83_03521 [Pseudogymnoascus destructans]ELR08379.1 hypothetical protein GMDG_03168 [Pseudogymnoascus destructans 20631-21]OAF60329.1 hypothetical protein VC83_03521 [Pseudogymnoascus destructans]